MSCSSNQVICPLYFQLSAEEEVILDCPVLSLLRFKQSYLKYFGMHWPIQAPTIYYCTTSSDPMRITYTTNVKPWKYAPYEGARQWIEWMFEISVRSNNKVIPFIYKSSHTFKQFSDIVISGLGVTYLDYQLMVDAPRRVIKAAFLTLSSIVEYKTLFLQRIRCKYSHQRLENLTDKITLIDDFDWEFILGDDARAKSRFSVIEYLDFDSEACTGKLIATVECLRRKILFDPNLTSAWVNCVQQSLGNLQRLQKVTAPSVDPNESVRRCSINEVLHGATAFMIDNFNTTLNVNSKQVQNAPDNCPDYATGWGICDYVISNSIISTASDGERSEDAIEHDDDDNNSELTVADGDDQYNHDEDRELDLNMNNEIRSIGQSTLDEGVKSDTLDDNALAQILCIMYDRAEAIARPPAGAPVQFPVVVNGILTTGHRFYVFTLTQFDLENKTSPLVEYHGCARMKVLRKLVGPYTGHGVIDGMVTKVQVPDISFTEVEDVLLAIMAVLLGMLTETEESDGEEQEEEDKLWLDQMWTSTSRERASEEVSTESTGTSSSSKALVMSAMTTPNVLYIDKSPSKKKNKKPRL